MLHIGAIATGLATAAAAAAFAIAASKAAADARRRNSGRIVMWLFGIISVFLAIATLRQTAGILSGLDEAWIAWDRALFYVVVIPAALTSFPLVGLTARLLAWPRLVTRAVLVVFAVAVVVGLSAVYIGGIDGPRTSPWGTEWAMNSIVAGAMVLLVLTLPALVFSGLVLWTGRSLNEPHRTRTVRVGAACLMYYIVFTVDAFAAPGPALLVERLVTFMAGIVAVSAYYPPPLDLDATLERPGAEQRLRRRG